MFDTHYGLSRYEPSAQVFVWLVICSVIF